MSRHPQSPPYTVLMVCMGNICRSPTAHAVLEQHVRRAGLQDKVRVMSAGTHAYHEGAPPDDRSSRHAARRGYDLSALRARHLSDADLERADLVLVMDWDNLALTQGMAQAHQQPKIRRLTEFCLIHDTPVVPDPYAGGPAGFEQVLDLIEDACSGLLRHLQRVTAQPGR